MEELSEFGDKFKEIFDLCDVDKDGFIDVVHFVELAKDHFGAEGTTNEELTGIINLLDPDGRGFISFPDFCEGIKQILEIQQQVSRDSFRGSVSEETLVPLDIAGDLSSLGNRRSSPSSSQNTYAEYDFSGFDEPSGLDANGAGIAGQNIFPLPVTELNGHPLVITSISEDEEDSALSVKSSEINENSRQEVTDEENYEDFGELESSEADVSDQGHLTPSTPKKRDRKDHLSRHPKKPW